MTLGELKEKIKQLEIDHPELTDDSDVYFYDFGIFLDTDEIKVDIDGDLIFAEE